ncbi:MAG: methyltransferase domain-containing protein [Myxococcales bacterium]|nr:methyltransferase domain-containing protein [Myxococcales bacterium]
MIRRLADRFDVDLSYYLSGGSLLLIDQGVGMVTGLATAWCFSTYAPKTTYGAYGYIGAIVGMLSLIALPGVSQAIQRSAARGFDGAFAIGMRQRLKAGGVASVILLLLGAIFFLSGQQANAVGALVASVLFPFAYAMDDYRSVLFGKQRFGLYLALHTMLQVAVAAGTIAAILLSFSFPAILFANMASRAVVNGAWWLAVQKTVIANRKVDADFRRYGWNLSLVGIVGGISYHLDRVIVGATLGLETMAAYELSFRLTEPLRSLGVFLNKLVFPRAVKVSGAAVARRFLSRTFIMSAGLAGLGVIGVWLCGPAIRLVFPNYPEAIGMTRWMIWSALISIVLIYLETYYLAQERFVRTYYAVSALRPIGIIVLLPFFIARWGAYGAIGAKLLVRVFEAVFLVAKLTADWLLLWREEAIEKPGSLPLGPQEWGRCPLCGDPATRPRWTVRDRLHGLPGRFSLVQCRGCGLLRLQPRLTANAVGLYYPPDYGAHRQERPAALGRGRTHRWRRLWVEWLLAGRPGPGEIGWRRAALTWPARLFGLTAAARFNPFAYPGEGRRLLDIGCASGDFLVEMRALGWDASGVEFAESAAATARERGLTVTVGSFPEVAGALPGAYDLIAMRQVVEHLSDPAAALRQVRELLAPSGALLLATPLADGWLARAAGRYWYPLDPPRHTMVFDRRQLAALLRIAGFRVAALLDHSSTTSWTRSLDYWLADLPWNARPPRVDRSRLLHRLLAGPTRLSDWFGRGDGGIVLAVRDDAPAAGWAPREIQEGRVR